MKRIYISVLMVLVALLLSAPQKPEFREDSSTNQVPEETRDRKSNQAQAPGSPDSSDEVVALRNLVDKQQAAIAALAEDNRKLSGRVDALEAENKTLKQKLAEKK